MTEFVEDIVLKASGLVFTDAAGVPFLRLDAGRDPSGGNVSVDLHNLLPPGPDGSGRIGIDIIPAPGLTYQAATETILYGTSPKSGTEFRRFNMSAMVDGTFRFGQESGGQFFHKAVIFANETRDGQVQAGTEDVFGYDATQRVGSSTPINIMNGHIRFDIPSRGGNLNNYWLARGGAGVEFNAPTGGAVQLLSNGQPVVNAGGNANGKLLSFYGVAPVHRPVVTGSRAGADDTTLSLLAALSALGLVTDGTTP